MHVSRDDLSPSSLFRKAPVPDSTLPLSTSQSSSLRSSPTRSLPCPESLVACLVYFDPKSYIVRSRQLLPRRLSRASASTRARIVFYSSSLRVCFFSKGTQDDMIYFMEATKKAHLGGAWSSLLSGWCQVCQATQLRTDGVYYRESAGTGPAVLKVAR